MAVGEYVGACSDDGMSIGTATTDKVSLYGVTPVVQASAVTAVDTSSTTDDVVASTTAIIAALKGIGITA